MQVIAEISKFDDIIDVRDIIARVEDLEETLPSDDEDLAELDTLKSLLSDLAGNGGDEQWNGEWYPVTLIRDSYFVEYCQELVVKIGDLPNGIPSYIVIDWRATARNIRMDYSSVEFDGVTYWYC